MQSSSANPTAGESVLIDTRGMTAPRNVLTILERVSTLRDSHARIEVRLDANPMQLYDLLQQRGFFLDITRQDDGTFSGVIRQRDIAALKH